MTSSSQHPVLGKGTEPKEKDKENENENENDTRPGSGPGPISLLEEYDPDDLGIICAPHAYVADYVVRVGLSVDVPGEMASYEKRAGGGGEDGEGEGKGWFERVRDELQAGEAIGWYVVVCGDEVRETVDDGVERWWSEDGSDYEGEGWAEGEGEGGGERHGGERHGSFGGEEEEGHPDAGVVAKPKKRGLRRLLSRHFGNEEKELR